MTEDELTIQKVTGEFTRGEIIPLVSSIENENRCPHNMLKKCADLGLIGITVPRQYGGAGASLLADVVAIEEIARAGIGMEWLISMNNSIAAVLCEFGTEDIKSSYLPPVCRGEACFSILFTEPETGSDPKLVNTRARLDGDYYTVTGEKRFISWGDWNGTGILFVKDDDDGITCLLIEKNTEGYSTGEPYKKIGSPAQEAVDVYFDNMKVPAGNILGEKGKGFDILLWWIAAEKIQQSAAALGIAEEALDESVRYCKQRQQRNGPIADLQGIQWTLAEMRTKIEAARWLTYKCACLREEQASDWITMAALNKIVAIPMAVEVTRLGMQLHSAYGYTRDMPIGRLHEAALGGLGIATSIEINKSIVGKDLIK